MGEGQVAPTGRDPQSTALRMQILTTEHASLVAARNLAWSESFSRAAMYLATLSGAIVALGLIAGIDHFGQTFVVFALVILPIVLFIGVATFIRMGAANYHDALAVVGMNRIRAGYLELDPKAAPYFVMGVHDDDPGIALTMAVLPNNGQILHVIAATPFVVTVLDAVVAGAIAVIAVSGALNLVPAVGLVAAAVAFVLVVLLHSRVIRGNIRSLKALMHPLFPTPSEPENPAV